MPHLRPTRPNTATREGRRCSHVGATSSFFFFFYSRLTPTRLRLEMNGADSRQLEPYQAKLPIQAKIQKKRCKTHRLNLITNPKGPKLSHAFSLHSNFSSLSFVSLYCVAVCSTALCLSVLCALLSASLSLRHSTTESRLNSHSHTHTISLLTHSQSCELYLIYEHHVLVIIYYYS